MTIKSLARALPLLLVGWMSILVIVALLTDAAPAYVVLLPSAALLNDLPDTTSIIAASSYSVTLASDQSGIARALYGSGAWLVLPAGLPGCLPLPQQ